VGQATAYRAEQAWNGAWGLHRRLVRDANDLGAQPLALGLYRRKRLPVGEPTVPSPSRKRTAY
jgi:hypothetical protein